MIDNEVKKTIKKIKDSKPIPYYTSESISINYNTSYKIDSLKLAFIQLLLLFDGGIKSTNFWGTLECPPEADIWIPGFVRLSNNQWVPHYITINANGEISQNATGLATGIWICGSYKYN